MDIGSAFHLLETALLRFHGFVDHEGREVVDDCFALLGSDLSFAAA